MVSRSVLLLPVSVRLPKFQVAAPPPAPITGLVGSLQKLAVLIAPRLLVSVPLVTLTLVQSTKASPESSVSTIETLFIVPPGMSTASV